MTTNEDEAFEQWVAALEARHLANLTFTEVSRALRALSATYVERRERIREGAALSGAGKRAAFALFYSPLHYLTVREVVRHQPGADAGGPTLVDVGCGTGAAGAAWATMCRHRPEIVAIDRHPWAVAEASRTYRAFGLKSRTERGDVVKAVWPGPPVLLVAAFTINELADSARDVMLDRLLSRASAGDQVLVVEPLAGFVARWWDSWSERFARLGGRADRWRFRIELPLLVARLDRAAGLDHREITARSLWLPGRRGPRD